jgi:6-pyruvoyltetrahydropterin/6-carboxytetrahydropterin synthase
MTKITQNTGFDASHRLLGYEGSCRNLHGHFWGVLIELESKRNFDQCGMLLDYRTIKNYIKSTFDHRAILNENDPLVPLLIGLDLDVTTMPGNPTAENIVRKIISDIVLLANLKDDDYLHVVVKESADNSAEEWY